jgi:hypothetical protein
MEDKDVLWLDSQRIPHSDMRWDLGTKPDGSVPTCYASVLAFTDDFDTSGTGVWRERSTKLSLLKTVENNSAAQVS